MTNRNAKSTEAVRISTHTLTWSVTLDWKNCGHTVADFNSHAHVERDTTRLEKSVIKDISTHTLTWSVTKCCHFSYLLIVISTHTLTWSVTSY